MGISPGKAKPFEEVFEVKVLKIDQKVFTRARARARCIPHMKVRECCC